MNKSIIIGHFTSFGIPLFLIVLVVFIAKSPVFHINPSAISIGITFDLLLTVPLVHFLLIRKTATSITILPFFVIGIIVATIILPVENQQLIHFAQTRILPIVEAALIILVAYKVRGAIKEYKQNIELTFDFFSALKSVCFKLLPKSAATLLASEIAVVYYGFIQWKKIIPNRNEFTYHKNTGTIGFLLTIIFLVIAEACIMHLLLARWNLFVAWTLTSLSIYTVIQLFGFLKSIALRPIAIVYDKLFLCYGILNETIVNIEDIESVDITSKSIEFDSETRSLSLFGNLEGHNLIIRLKKESTLSGLYGINRKFITIALHVDNKDEFKTQIERIKEH